MGIATSPSGGVGDDRVGREVNLYLLLNTDLGWTEDLLANEAFASLAHTCQQLSSAQYLEVVWRAELWPHLLEALYGLGEDEAGRLYLSILPLPRHLTPSLERLVIWTGLASTGLARPNAGNLLQGYCAMLLDPHERRPEELPYRLISVLTTLRTLLDREQRYQVLPHWSKFAGLYKFRKLEEQKEFKKEEQCEKEEWLNSLLITLEALVANLDIDTWLGWCEVSSKELLRYNSWILFWSGDQQHVPSNIQLLTAHLLSECDQLLTGLKKNPKVAQVLPIVKGFARPYCRELELGLEEMELPQLIQQLRQLPEAWQRQAVLRRLLVSFLGEALSDEDCATLLAENSSLIEPDMGTVQPVIRQLVHMGSHGRLRPHHKTFLLDLCRRLKPASWPPLITWLVTEFGHADCLEAEDFEANIIEELNKAGLGEEGTVDVSSSTEFCLLALQNGRKTIEQLVRAAAQNAGQIPTAVVILQQAAVEPICAHSFSSDDPRSTLGVQLIGQLEFNKAKELDNSIELYLALAKGSVRYAVEVCSLLPRIISDCWARRAYNDCRLYADVLVRSLNDTEVLKKEGQLTLATVLTAVITLVEIVNASSAATVVPCGEPVADGFALLELSLGGLDCLLRRRRPDVEPVMEQLLAPSCRGYFLSAPTSLLAALQALLFNRRPENATFWPGGRKWKEDRSLIVGEAALVLPRLLRYDWQHLLEMLISVHEETEGREIPSRVGKGGVCPEEAAEEEEEDRPKTSVLAALETLSQALSAYQPILQQSPAHQELVEYMVLAFGTVVTSYINSSGRAGALALSSLLIQIIWNFSGSVTLSQLLWPSCHAAIARLLSLHPREEEIRDICYSLAVLQVSESRSLALRMLENHVTKS